MLHEGVASLNILAAHLASRRASYRAFGVDKAIGGRKHENGIIMVWDQHRWRHL